MFINPKRMLTVTDAKPKFNALVADAERGRVTHILKNSTVVAHVVPAKAWIHEDPDALQAMVVLAADAAAAYAAAGNGWDGDRLYSATDDYGRVLAWAWRCDIALFSQALAVFHAALEKHVGQSISREQLTLGVENALGAGLSPAEVQSVADYLATQDYWTHYYPHPHDPFVLPYDGVESSR